LNDFGLKGAVRRLTAPYLLKTLGVNFFWDISALKLKGRFVPISTNPRNHRERTRKMGGKTMASKSANCFHSGKTIPNRLCQRGMFVGVTRQCQKLTLGCLHLTQAAGDGQSRGTNARHDAADE
jgi:hypothetical protein